MFQVKGSATKVLCAVMSAGGRRVRKLSVPEGKRLSEALASLYPTEPSEGLENAGGVGPG